MLGFLTGALCVWLLIKQNIWNWPIGIANNIFYIFIFFRSGLYADMGLQLLYIAIALYGWWNWLHGAKNHSELKIGRASSVGLLGYSAMAAFSTAVLFWVLRRFTPSTVPLRRRTHHLAVPDRAVHDVAQASGELVVLDCGRHAGHRSLYL
jgi:nicotinamide mononucleotide transporter